MDDQERRVIRVIICDDQRVVREGLAAILRTVPSISVVGQAEHGESALALLQKQAADVVLMDLNMPVLDGVQTTREIGKRFPQVAVLVLTTYASEDWLFDALRAGARGYLLKDTRREELTRAIHDVARGLSPLDPAVAGKVLQQAIRATPVAVKAAGTLLSQREKEILALIALGHSNSEIAAKLHLAHGTVRNYVSDIIAKLDASDRTHAATLATKHGWI